MSFETLITIVGSAFGLIAIIQTWRIHRINKRDRITKGIEFYYEIKKTLSTRNIPFDVKLHFNSKLHENLYCVEAIIGNKGNIVFTQNDLLKPLRLNSSQPVEILEYEIIDKTKDDLDCKIIEGNGDTKLLTFVIDNFEPRDAFKFRMLIASVNQSITLELDGLIKDENIDIKPKTHEINKYDYRSAAEGGGLGESSFIIVFALLIGIPMGFYYLFLWLQGLFLSWLKTELHFTLTSSEILSFVLGAVIIFGIITLIIIILKKIKIIEKLKREPKRVPTLTGFGPWFDLRIRTKKVFDHLD